MRLILSAITLSLLPAMAMAHQLTVFASVDCEAVLVEAKFSNGKHPIKGDVRIYDGTRSLLTTLALETNGTIKVPLDTVNHKGGLVVEVDTGGHDNYWIVTPEDIARGCEN